MIRRFVVYHELDEQGEPVQFTWDLFTLIDPDATTHLDENGLAKPGAAVRPGSILVGKIGRSAVYRRGLEPNPLEIHSMDFAELNRRFSHLWIDRSFYAPNDLFGVVVHSCLTEDRGIPCAIVEVEERQ